VGYSEYAPATGQTVESMSFGKMNTQIQITQKQVTLDDEGFQTESNVVVATVRAYREGRHGSEKWANRAAFSEATDLFRFRTIPGLTVTADMRLICGGSVFEITSVEDVKGRGMYIEVLCKEVQSSG
jgi:SPP1 family predicted phage head-tail adaptor